ncbi:MAG: pyridoxamine 5'-phosphate oxidase family protein [Solirubrobacterales bacterium]|nr:pyridoxamine 5'-phosphate oxidase family protein [Solirubrobacterales bacterium]
MLHGSRQTKLVELTREECLALLSSRGFGRLAVAGSGETPIIRPVNYVFDERAQAVAFRTAAGSKLYFLVRAAKAAFEIDEIDQAGRTGWSVIIAGVTEEVTSAADVRRLEGLGLDTWPPGERSHWVRIRTAAVSGRRIAAVEIAEQT